MDMNKAWSRMDKGTQAQVNNLYRRYKQYNDESALSEIKKIFKTYNYANTVQTQTLCPTSTAHRNQKNPSTRPRQPEKMIDLECKKCKKTFEVPEKTGPKWCVANLQKGYEPESFCSKECMLEWVRTKKATMVLCLVLGVVLAILAAKDSYGASLGFVFIPYMIRQVKHGLKEIFNLGWFGQLISFAVVFLGSVTFFYPIYKLIQEIKLFSTIHKRFGIS